MSALHPRDPEFQRQVADLAGQLPNDLALRRDTPA